MGSTRWPERGVALDTGGPEGERSKGAVGAYSTPPLTAHTILSTFSSPACSLGACRSTAVSMCWSTTVRGCVHACVRACIRYSEQNARVHACGVLVFVHQFVCSARCVFFPGYPVSTLLSRGYLTTRSPLAHAHTHAAAEPCPVTDITQMDPEAMRKAFKTNVRGVRRLGLWGTAMGPAGLHAKYRTFS